MRGEERGHPCEDPGRDVTVIDESGHRRARQQQDRGDPGEVAPGPGTDPHELTAGAVILDRSSDPNPRQRAGPDLQVPPIEGAAVGDRDTLLPEGRVELARPRR